jgi:hypothetical protein
MSSEITGSSPLPQRDAHPRWSTFLKAHWECLAATNFLSVEVCTIRGLVTQYVLFFIDIASRSVHVAGITPHPDNYSDEFCNVLVREGVHVVRLPPRSPLIDNPPQHSRIVAEEPFGPILPVLRWTGEADVIRRANDSIYGLGPRCGARTSTPCDGSAINLKPVLCGSMKSINTRRIKRSWPQAIRYWVRKCIAWPDGIHQLAHHHFEQGGGPRCLELSPPQQNFTWGARHETFATE